jgi:hypothetical protein
MESCGRRFRHLMDTRSPDMSKGLSGGLKAEAVVQPRDLSRGVEAIGKGKG